MKFSHVVPETGRVMLVQFYRDDDELHRLPVLAWCVDGKVAEPVTCEELSSDVWCLEFRAHDGTPYSWVFPNHQCACETEADARKSAEERFARKGRMTALLDEKRAGIVCNQGGQPNGDATIAGPPETQT